MQDNVTHSIRNYTHCASLPRDLTSYILRRPNMEYPQEPLFCGFLARSASDHARVFHLEVSRVSTL